MSYNVAISAVRRKLHKELAVEYILESGRLVGEATGELNSSDEKCREARELLEEAVSRLKKAIAELNEVL